MRSSNSIIAVLFSLFCTSALHAQQQQNIQINLSQDALIVSAETQCPDGMVRKVYTRFEQVAQQGFGSTQHYCVRGSDAEPDGENAADLVEETAWPTRVSLADLGPVGMNSEHTPIELTDEQMLLLRSEISEMEFADYRLSGCHDRAHAAFLMLPAELQEAAFKIWVASPSVFTRGVRGAITFPADKDVSWGYHVSLAFLTADGIKVFDPTLSAGRLLTEAEWFGSFRYPSLSMRIYTPGTAYLFFNEEPAVIELNQSYSFVVNKALWVGNYFKYEGISLEQHWIPTSLARDEIGALVQNDRACDGLAEFKGKPGELEAALKEGAAPGCEAEYALFEETKERWINQLSG